MKLIMRVLKLPVMILKKKLDRRFPKLEGEKYCVSCNMYLDNSTAYNEHAEPLKHTNNERLDNGEIIKNWS